MSDLQNLSDEERQEYELLFERLSCGEIDGKTFSPEEQTEEILLLGIRLGERRMNQGQSLSPHLCPVCNGHGVEL